MLQRHKQCSLGSDGSLPDRITLRFYFLFLSNFDFAKILQEGCLLEASSLFRSYVSLLCDLSLFA